MKKKKVSDRETVRQIEEKTKTFTCAGCGRRVVSDGTPKTKAFVWTHTKTKKRSKYCYICDDKLIQGVM